MATESTHTQNWLRGNEGKVPGLRNLNPPVDDSTGRILLHLWDLYRVGNGLPPGYKAVEDGYLYRLYPRRMAEITKHAVQRTYITAESFPSGNKPRKDNVVFDRRFSILPELDNEDSLNFIVNHINWYLELNEEPIDPLQHSFLRILCPLTCERHADRLERLLGYPRSTISPISSEEKQDRPEWQLALRNKQHARSKQPWALRVNRARHNNDSDVCCDGVHYESRNYEGGKGDKDVATDFIDGDLTNHEKEEMQKVLRLFAVLEDLYRTHKVPSSYDATLDQNLWDFDRHWTDSAMRLITKRDRTDINNGLIVYTWEPLTQSDSPNDHIKSLFSYNAYDNVSTLRSVVKACVQYFGRDGVYTRYVSETDDGVPGALQFHKLQPEQQNVFPLDHSPWHYDAKEDRFLRLLFPYASQEFNFESLQRLHEDVQAPNNNVAQLQEAYADPGKLYPLCRLEPCYNCSFSKGKKVEGYRFDPNHAYPAESPWYDSSDYDISSHDSQDSSESESEQDSVFDDSEIEEVAGARISRRELLVHKLPIPGPGHQDTSDRKRKFAHSDDDDEDTVLIDRKTHKLRRPDRTSSDAVAGSSKDGPPAGGDKQSSSETKQDSIEENTSLSGMAMSKRNSHLESLLALKDRQFRMQKVEATMSDKRLAAHAEEIKTLKARVSKLNDTAETMRSSLNTKAQEAAHLSHNLGLRETHIDTLQEEAKRYKDEIAGLKKRVSGLQDEVASVKEENSSLKSKNASLENEKAESQRQVTSLKADSIEYEKGLKSCDGEINSLKESIEVLEKTIEMLQAEN
ncbi:hypothetical protein PG993_006849 [Apiospora rasikravindrae]|uniref:Uncharacterized protein n=1 Tax=Apiospora rasikravindrae TaxID=990691 RepID=A0ABR1SVV1_9PEZI